jgi:cysteine desulfurase
MAKPIYLDHHATTPLDPRVLERMLPFFTEHFGNAASADHAYGWAAAEAVEAAREAVAALLNASAAEIVFTSGATESCNLAWLGLAQPQAQRRHLVTSAVEHASILATAHHLRAHGWEVTVLPVDGDGRVDPAAVERAVRADTLLVSVQYANNEVGTLQPIADIGRICRARGALFHSDATQAAAWLPLDVHADRIDLLSLSAHKMHGPKGVGALYVRRTSPALPLAAVVHGGGQEHGLRPGTLNVPAIVGFGEACRLALAERDADCRRVRALRNALWASIRGEPGAATLNGHAHERLPNNLHASFCAVAAERVIGALKGVALSTGAACASGRREPSHVLRAMGRDLDAVHGSLRFGLGRFTTADEIVQAAERINAVLEREREPVHES